MEENNIEKEEIKIEDGSSPKVKKILIFCLILLIVIIILTIVILSIWGNSSSSSNGGKCDDGDTCHIHFIKLIYELLK